MESLGERDFFCFSRSVSFHWRRRKLSGLPLISYLNRHCISVVWQGPCGHSEQNPRREVKLCPCYKKSDYETPPAPAAPPAGESCCFSSGQQSQADLSQDLEGSQQQEGELVLTEEANQSEGEQVEASSCQDAFEYGKAMELDTGALDENLCPREEDTEEILGSPGCKTCRYRLVHTPRTFADAQDTCWRCYRGNLASIHSLSINNQLQCLASKINQQQVWIGGAIGGWCFGFHWLDRSPINFSYWSNQRGNGRCVTLCTKGNDAHYLNSQESQADLSQDLVGSGEQEGELVLTEEAIQSQGEQVEASSCQDSSEDEKAMESDPGALDENFQCPREEDTVTILVSAGYRNGRYRLVKTPKTFADARCPQLHWIDGSIVNYSHWSHHHGHGHCVTLSTRGGYWQQSCCERLLPFVCSS
ncbi:Proteoglycan 3 [Myotis davidii]|uniref:Proteoglycan 3 n=1 Tax=Myotis davidii TaxID=225400 RepID=L5LC73_MYODS|nr:Proteoglycan 3 [Myotis davidii]